MNRHSLAFVCGVAAVLLCAAVGFSQAPLQIPLGTNVVGAVAMNALTLQSLPVHITGGEDTEIPLTVFFRRKVDHESAAVSASARFSLDVTVRVRASTIAAVAGVSMANYDNMSTLTKLQASSAVGLQLGVPKLRAVLAALYTGVGTDDVGVSAQAASLGAQPPTPPTGASFPVTVLVSSDDADAGGEVIAIPESIMRRAEAVAAEAARIAP